MHGNRYERTIKLPSTDLKVESCTGAENADSCQFASQLLDMGMWHEHVHHSVTMEKCCSDLLRRDVFVLLRSCIPRGAARQIASAADSRLTGTVQAVVPNEPWEKVDGARGEGQVHSSDRTYLITH